MPLTTATNNRSDIDSTSGDAGFSEGFLPGEARDDRNNKFRMPPFIGTTGEKGLGSHQINGHPKAEIAKKHHEFQPNGHDKLHAPPTFPGSILPDLKSQLRTYATETLVSLSPPRTDPEHSLEIRARITNRDRLQLGRITAQEDENTLYAPYVPYATVKDRWIRHRLLRIAESVTFLDECFAICFPSVIDGDPAYACQQLGDIRRRIAETQKTQTQHHQQSGGAQPGSEEAAVVLGDLGHFFERVLQVYPLTKTKDAMLPGDPTPPSFIVTRRNATDTLRYLQDALEVPYWDFMLREFGKWRNNNPSEWTGDATLRVLYSSKIELRVAVAQLRDAIRSRHSGGDDITPILKGIERRIAVLDGIWDAKMEGLRILEDHFQNCICREGTQLEGLKIPPVSVVESLGPIAAGSKDTVIGIIAVFIFLAPAIGAFSMGFAISSKNGGPGSWNDADFWFLLQSNIMWTLGSIIMIVPLMRGPWLSLAYLPMWIFLAAGLACAVISMAIYAHVNTGWSSMFAFFGSIASAAAVLVMTQGTVNGEGQMQPEKFKKD